MTFHWKEVMASGVSVLGLIRASRPAFISSHERFAFAVNHTSLLTGGYSRTARGSGSASSSAGGSSSGRNSDKRGEKLHRHYQRQRPDQPKDNSNVFSSVRSDFVSRPPLQPERKCESLALPTRRRNSHTDSEGYLVGGTYCVLLTGHASDYTQKLHGGYGQMFIKLLGDPGEKWDVYAVVDGQFPAEEELERYDGFVVTGSRHDAHGSEDWIAKLCALLQSLHEKKQNMLGVCFGHQVMSRALGGKTGKSDVGWEIGLRKVQTTDVLATKPYAVGVPPTFRVLESHQDQVQEVPPGAELLGYSDKTSIEIFAVGDHVLGIQGHPEFTEDVVIDIIDSRLAAGILKDEEAKAAKATLRAGQADQEALIKLCKGFIKRRT